MAKVTFLTTKKTLEIENGKTLEKGIGKADVGLLFGCRDGHCGSCLVRVVDQPENLSQPEKREKTVLRNLSATAEERLACQAQVLGDCSIDAVE
jgi:ferredoxin